jgi:hypothetical protein
MLDTSKRGVEVLRVLALAIRTEEDHGLLKNDPTTVGAFKSPVTDRDVVAAIRDYRPPYGQLPHHVPLGLRAALNKIAHADPKRSGFFADDKTHDLILSGSHRGDTWIAVLSLIDLCSAISSLPDVQVALA